MWMSAWPAHAAKSVQTSMAPTNATADRATSSGRMGTPATVGNSSFHTEVSHLCAKPIFWTHFNLLIWLLFFHIAQTSTSALRASAICAPTSVWTFLGAIGAHVRNTDTPCLQMDALAEVKGPFFKMLLQPFKSRYNDECPLVWICLAYTQLKRDWSLLTSDCVADIDECTTGVHNCSLAETCYNIQGGYRCLSLNCPPNYRKVSDTCVKPHLSHIFQVLHMALWTHSSSVFSPCADAVSGLAAPITWIVRTLPSELPTTTSASSPTSSSLLRSSASGPPPRTPGTTSSSASRRATRTTTSARGSWTPTRAPCIYSGRSKVRGTSSSTWRWSSGGRGRSPPSTPASTSSSQAILCDGHGGLFMWLFNSVVQYTTTCH